MTVEGGLPPLRCCISLNKLNTTCRQDVDIETISENDVNTRDYCPSPGKIDKLIKKYEDALVIDYLYQCAPLH
jgi:hypothetical protein